MNGNGRAMLRSSPTPFVTALMIAVSLLLPTALRAQETPTETAYAELLGQINPHLRPPQRIAFARSLLADAERSNVDPRLIFAVVTVESHWRPNAVSRVGAQGLGQLMPRTASALGVNPRNPSENLRGAAAYLRRMLDHFGGEGDDALRFAVGAYNAGPQAVDKYHGIPPYRETQNYVRKVLSLWHSLVGRLEGSTASAAAPPHSGDAGWLSNNETSAVADTVR